MFVNDKSFFAVFKEMIFAKNKPDCRIPSVKTDLLHLDPKNDILVWFGHASYFIQIDGKKLLVDPVFSGSVSPLPFMTKAFEGTDRYTADDMPEIDYLIITHDHWDHLDYETIMKLKPKIKKIICGLGVGEHFEYWGFDPKLLEEKDWNESIQLDQGFTATVLPARHFSGRLLQRNRSLWISVLLQTPTFKIYFSGDGGYDGHFAEIGKKFGPIDFAILENGQYNVNWRYIHMMPEQTVQAAKDLKVKRFLPVHSSKFALSIHSWDEPLKRVTALSKKAGITIVTPLIGEQVHLKDSTQTFSEWWKNVK
jgi:L-ascorbate metabolism protein UlaG (beta-lactamase superfamily)